MLLSIRAKLLFFIGSIIFVTLTSSSAHNAATAKNVIIDAQKKHLEYITLTVGGVVKADISRARTDISFAVNMPSIKKGVHLRPDTVLTPDKKALCDLLTRLAELSSNYETFYLTDGKGRTLASNLIESVGVLNISTRPWFYNTLQTGDIYTSTPFVSRITGKYLIAVSQRFEYDGITGVMVGSLDLSRIIDPLLQKVKSPDLDLLVVSTQGKVISSPDPTLRNTAINPDIFKILHGPPAHPQFITLDDERKLLAYHRIPETSLFVVILANYEYVAKFINPVDEQAYLSLGIALLFASITIALLIFPVTRDIKKLSTYAQGIAAGKSTITTGVRRKDELGKLEESLSQMVETLQDMIEKSTAATQAKSDFLARMSHEIRTPMNSVLGMTYLAMQNSPEPKQKQFLQKIDSAAKNLLAIINDILDFSKMEAGKMSITPYSFKLSGMLRSILELFQITCHEKGILLETDIDPNVPNVLYGDSLRISQICINLISNAIKFTEEGSITLKIALQERTEDSLILHFSIADTGIGMDENQLTTIFDSFTQADGSATRRFGGTGLGLAICKLLVGLMDGAIWVESKEGVGSTFNFTITLKEGSSDQINEAETENPLKFDTPLLPMHVLLVDDNEINREIAIEILKEMDITCTTATNGSEAVQLYQSEDFDMILMDIQMPVMDGLTATRLIRKHAEEKGIEVIPIIAMTANAMSGDRQKSLDSGMHDYVAKPIDIAQLRSVLLRWQKTTN